MRTLILSCNTGEGHNSCAKAITECFAAHGEVCDTVDSLLFISEGASKFICNWHVRMYRHIPKLIKNGYKGAENHSSIFQRDTLIYQYLTSGSERLYNYISDNEYDCVICTHVFPALALTDMLEKHPMPIAAAFVGTDYTCSPGTADSDLRYYFIPDEALRAEFSACGVPDERIVASGLPVRRAFYGRGGKAEARRTLGIGENKRHMLLMCGSMGCGPICELTEILSARMNDDEEMTVICGSNEKLYEKLMLEFSDSPNIRVEAHVDDMAPYMRASDLYITKPGGLSTTESAAMALPMLLIDAVAGCEEHNLDFFLKTGGAVTADTPEALAETALALLRDDARLAEMSAMLDGKADILPAERIYSVMKSEERALEAQSLRAAYACSSAVEDIPLPVAVTAPCPAAQ